MAQTGEENHATGVYLLGGLFSVWHLAISDTRVGRPLRSVRQGPILSHSPALDLRIFLEFPPFA